METPTTIKREIDEELDRLFAEQDRRRAAASPELFAEVVWKDQSGTPIILGAIHQRIHAFIARCKAEGRHAFIYAPWGHGKTETLLSWATQAICEDPNTRVKIVSNTDANAIQRVGAVRRYIEDDPDLSRIFPKVTIDGKGGDTRFTLKRESKSPNPTLEACGVMTSGTGGRCENLLFDDPVDEKSLSSPAHREAVVDKINNVWLPRLVPDGMAILIGTAWHKEDAGQKILDGAPDNGWDALVVKVSDNLERLDVEEITIEGIVHTVLPLWDAAWDKPALEARRALVGSTAFGRGMQQRTISGSDLIFKPEHIQRLPRSAFPPLDTLEVFLALDPAFKKSDRSDFCAIACVGFDPKTKVAYLLQMDRFKGTPYDVAMRYIAMIRKWHPRKGGVETNGGGEAVLKVIEQTMREQKVSLKIKSLVHSTDKVLRIQTTIEPVVERHPLVVPDDEAYDGFEQRFLSTPASRLDEQDALEMAFDIGRNVWQGRGGIAIGGVEFARRVR